MGVLNPCVNVARTLAWHNEKLPLLLREHVKESL